MLARPGAAKAGTTRAPELSPERRKIAQKAMKTRREQYGKIRGHQTRPATPTGGSSRLIADLGWNLEEAAKIRASLLSFEDDWNAPGMDEYDHL